MLRWLNFHWTSSLHTTTIAKQRQGLVHQWTARDTTSLHTMKLSNYKPDSPLPSKSHHYPWKLYTPLDHVPCYSQPSPPSYNSPAPSTSPLPYSYLVESNDHCWQQPFLVSSYLLVLSYRTELTATKEIISSVLQVSMSIYAFDLAVTNTFILGYSWRVKTCKGL